MRILVDMDETLVNLFDKWCYYYNNKYGTEYTRETVDYGDLGEDWIEFLRIPGFHADLPYMDPEAPKWLRRLKEDGHEIVIVTAPVSWESPRDKYSWIHTHLRIPGIIDSMKQVHITRDKQGVRGDILVDDRPEQYGGGQPYTITYTQPWNASYGTPYRANNWAEVYETVDDILMHRTIKPTSYHVGGCV